MIALLTFALNAHALDRPAPLPEPLPARSFQMADPAVATLANGLDVLVFSNHEVPLWEVRLVLGVGEYVDPDGKEGLAQLTYDLVDRGTADRSSAEISRALQLLGGSVTSGLRTDSATINASGIKRNLAKTLDIWADVVLNPSFPEEELEIRRTAQIAAVNVALADASATSGRVLSKLVYGDGYLGRAPTVTSLESLTRQDVETFHGTYTGPENALLLVGGDLTLDEVVPLLEARLGSWTVDDLSSAPVVAEPIAITEEVLYFIDDPGASQSVISSTTLVDRVEGPDWVPLEVANQMFARAFTSRVNMNLREDKGYTYGARCYASGRHGPGLYTCRSAVRTDVTGASLRELRGEIAAVRSDRPLTEDEVRISKSALVQSWPRKFETIPFILNQEFENWRYGLSEDRLTEYIPAVGAVDTAQANAALKRWLRPEATLWLIAGDREKVMTELEETGLPIVELDRTGTELEKN
jgi:zinc protease